MLENLVDRVSKLTSGNISHNIASIRSVTTNLTTVMVKDLIASCEKNDLEFKILLEKLERNIWGIDNIPKNCLSLISEVFTITLEEI